MYVPSSQPKLVAPGLYSAELDGDVVEKESKFDPEKKYYQVPLLLTSTRAAGEAVKYLWFCQPDSELWTNALLAIGGRRNASGGVDAPAHPEGRKFLVTIVKAVRKDGKEKRDIVSVERIDGPAAEEFSGPPADEGPDPLDQARRSDGDDVPF